MPEDYIHRLTPNLLQAEGLNLPQCPEGTELLPSGLVVPLEKELKTPQYVDLTSITDGVPKTVVMLDQILSSQEFLTFLLSPQEFLKSYVKDTKSLEEKTDKLVELIGDPQFWEVERRHTMSVPALEHVVPFIVDTLKHKRIYQSNPIDRINRPYMPTVYEAVSNAYWKIDQGLQANLHYIFSREQIDSQMTQEDQRSLLALLSNMASIELSRHDDLDSYILKLCDHLGAENALVNIKNVLENQKKLLNQSVQSEPVGIDHEISNIGLYIARNTSKRAEKTLRSGHTLHDLSPELITRLSNTVDNFIVRHRALRFGLYYVLQEIDLSPSECESVLVEMTKYSDLDHSYAYQLAYALLESNPESIWIQEHEARRQELLSVLDTDDSQTLLDAYQDLERQASKIISATLGEGDTGRKVGFEIETYIDNLPHIRLPSGFRAHVDFSAVEIIRHDDSLEYGDDYRQDLASLTSWVADYVDSLSSFHVHLDKKTHRQKPQGTELFLSKEGPIILDNILGTWEVRAALIMYHGGNKLHVRSMAALMDWFSESAASDKSFGTKPNLLHLDPHKKYDMKQLLWGYIAHEVRDPVARLAALIALQDPVHEKGWQALSSWNPLAVPFVFDPESFKRVLHTMNRSKYKDEFQNFLLQDILDQVKDNSQMIPPQYELIASILHSTTDRKIEIVCIEALKNIGNEEAILELIKKSQDQETTDYYTKGLCILALGEIKTEQSVISLIQLLQTTSEEYFKGICIEALGITVNKQAVFPIIQELENNTNVLMQRVCAEALGKIGSEQAIKPLIALLQTTESEYTQNTCIKALASIGSSQAVELLLIEMHATKDTLKQNAYIKALGELGSEKSVFPLIQILKTSTNKNTKRFCISALGKIGSDQALLPLIDLLPKVTDQDLKNECITALGLSGNKLAVLPVIQELKTSTFDDTKSVCIKALGEMGNFNVIEDALINELQTTPVYFLRINCIEAIGRIGSERSVLPILHILFQTPSDSGVAELCIETLGKIGSNQAVLPLFKYLQTAKDFYIINLTRQLLVKLVGDQAVLPNNQNLQGETNIDSFILNAQAIWSIANDLMPLRGRINSENIEYQISACINNF